MTEQFIITLLNMSFTAAVMAVIVLIIRLFIKRLPKWYSYALWGLVLFRLLCPVSITSPISLFPATRPINRQIVYAEVPSINSGMLLIDGPVNWILEETMTVKARYTSMNPIQYVLYTFLLIWEVGFFLFLLFNLVIYVRMRLRLRTAVKAEPGVLESDQISMPMVLGIIRPVIYLPCGVADEERECILRHERAHIKRWDHLAKPLGFLALAVHWFNPFVWVAFTKMCEDMEMSCDEKVLKELGAERRTDYSMALLQFSARKSGLFVPLAFGESHTRSRIKNVLKCKKPAFWISAAAVAGLVCAAVVFLTNPPVSSSSISIIGGADGPTSIFIAGKTTGAVNMIEAVPVHPEDVAGILLPEATGVSKASGDEINLDFASDEKIILHGSFGICVYEKQSGIWNMTGSVNLGLADERYHDASYLMKVFDMGEQLIIGFKTEDTYEGESYFFNIAKGTLEVINEFSEMLEPLEQQFLKQGLLTQMPENGRDIYLELPEQPNIYATYMIDDSRMGFLASDTDKGEALWYGVYDFDTLKMTRAMLFGKGSGNEVVIQEEAEGRAVGRKTSEAATQPRRELIRTSDEGRKTEILDKLAISYENDMVRRSVFQAGERIVFQGAASDEMVEFKRSSFISIAADGENMTVRLLSNEDDQTIATKEVPLIPMEEANSMPDKWKGIH